ncbi:MAG: SH3 domain-containing protein [Clostridia bacterium]|nr:SH3 domain-containing protein [Clostridia bacterium]
MGKRLMLWICALLLLCACAWAQADEEAVIFVRDGSKLHLRAEPSTDAPSLGLFFTGTQVVCLSPISDEWVSVRIGAQTGYMKGKYLRPGSDAQWIISEAPMAYVSASGTVNLRSGPSAEAKQVATIRSGRTLLILGETKNRWYYVKHEGKTGYVSAKLVELLYDAENHADSKAEWKQIYRRWIQENDQEGFLYDLIFVNADDVPELAVDTQSEAGGCRILTVQNGVMDELMLRRRGFGYIARANLLCNSDGLMDSYFDDVYVIEDGRWTRIAAGEYFGYNGGWDEASGRYVCASYLWNGEGMTMEAYLDALDAVFPRERAVKAAFEDDSERMLKELK